MLKAAAERLRLRAGEKISAHCSTGNLVVAREDLTAVLDALDLSDGLMPPAILAKAKFLKGNIRETRHAASAIDSARQDTFGWVGDELFAQLRKWSERTVDAAAALVDAVLAYEHTGAGGAATGVQLGAAVENSNMTSEDRPLDEDVAELNREAQKAVDREIAARVELDAAIANRVEVRRKIGEGSAAAVAFIDAYVNPTVSNPEPVAPDVAAPAPVEEPSVFTTVDTATANPENTSGGIAEDGIAPAIVLEDMPAIAPDTPVGGEGGGPA